MITEILKNYRSLIDNLEILIDASGYKNEYIARKLSMSPATFSMKKRRKSFKLEELEKLFSIISNEDVEDMIMLNIIQQRQNEDEISSEEFKEMMGWK
jgi:hypothetical protein